MDSVVCVHEWRVSAGEAESHLRLIAEVVPDFLSIIRLKSGEYVKIDQLADLSSVHDVIQNIVKAMWQYRANLFLFRRHFKHTNSFKDIQIQQL